MRLQWWAGLLVILGVACRPLEASDAGQDAMVSDTNRTDGANDGGATVPNIREALICGDRPMFGPGTVQDLKRAEIDTGVFPDAICNDGSKAAIYFRPYRGEQNRNKWLINLRGGGSCGSASSCAARWCSCNTVGAGNRCPYATESTNFTMANMISDGPRAQGGTGIFARDRANSPNPIQDYNQVRLVYCSSDGWTGTRRDVAVSTVHPITGAPVNYSIHFLGSKILDADLATLRGDGVSTPLYDLNGMNVAMPDLDDAVDVVLAGDSAGGLGVIVNLDKMASTLRSRNTNCQTGGACPLKVVGLIDSVTGPSMDRLDFSMSTHAAEGLTSYSAYLQVLDTSFGSLQGAVQDESCVSWHRTNMPGTESQCYDSSHVVRHHITTPYFVRMGLTDGLILQIYSDLGVRDPMLGAFGTAGAGLRAFAQVMQREMAALGMISPTLHEASAIRNAPGVFAPICSNHDTINEDSEVFGVTITPPNGTPKKLFDVFEPWHLNPATSSVLTSIDPMLQDTVCPP